MTQEEIIRAISEDKTMPFIQPEQLSVIVDFVIKNYKPSLPSNLDEAAEKASENRAKSILNYSEFAYQEHLRGFKAGAEWMAEHGVEAKVLQAFTDGSAYIECPYDGRSGDKVIVQIWNAK